MLEALTPILALLLTLYALSVVVSPMIGRRLDPFFLARPIARWMIRLPARACRWLSKLFDRWSGLAWKRANRTQFVPLKITLYLTSAALGMTGMLLTIPAELLGEIKRL
ncbi:MAG: hypothetical protein UW94_C0006G0039 [Parcubacteria group bacterium GW2011_GWA2_45_14]|nr:MAG: hypothetical protein UW94_C0006G0039 [Parcubacteria group bacterium GW2011_GWA2_45_14]